MAAVGGSAGGSQCVCVRLAAAAASVQCGGAASGVINIDLRGDRSVLGGKNGFKWERFV